ncbi:MAG: EamA family transporter [Gammaproteobacteria bacterium]|nr:EamA family transporter [Gammaproteobacteria bacterium]
MQARYPVLFGFIIVVIIWSTTPLAVKWSGEGPGFLFGVTARMVIGTVVLLLLARIKRVTVPWHRSAIKTYLAAGLGIYGAMICVYWGAQFIASGFISVIFGLAPILTGVFAWFILEERGLTPLRLFGILLGLVGLAFIFQRSMNLGHTVLMGIAAVLISVTLHAFSGVLVKRLHGDLPALSVTTGGLLIATPLYLLTWWIQDGHWPQQIPTQALWSIVYLGVIATGIGFTLYFYILKYMQASQVALLTLLTPVLALWFGNLFNHEVVGVSAWFGTGLILFGMGIYQWGGLWLQRFR